MMQLKRLSLREMRSRGSKPWLTSTRSTSITGYGRESCRILLVASGLVVQRELLNSRQVTSIELCAWLGGLEEFKGTGSASFLTIEEVGKFLNGKLRFLLFV
jgi:hypothetical protein